MSIEKALPLQIHPDRQLAEKLHKQDPEKFPDTNHKPEIAIAISQFELFASWKPLSDLTQLFQHPPLKKFMLTSQTNFNDDSLKRVAQNILEADDLVIAEALERLTQMPETAFVKYTYIPKMLERVKSQYTAFDNSNLLAVICMNYLILKAAVIHSHHTPR